ncbi:MAG: sulfite exporter TauE/SafE family protein [Acidobacteria bacterium]|nr:sulfite exporter TauE/SafE family protein [Acidobacteriota bacterium]
MSPLEFSLVFTLGLVGSLHCLQMCGPIVLTWSVSLPRASALRAHLRYNAGRILTYMMLGAVAGAVGRAIGLLGRMAGLASGVRILAGGAMVLSGILMIGLFNTNGLIAIRRPSRFSRWIGRNLLGPERKFQLGVLLGFLPCGLIYAALLKAVDSGGPVEGALTMLAFGLGTAVSLLALGAASSLAGFHLSRWSTRLAALCVIATGALLLYRGFTAAPVCHQVGQSSRPVQSRSLCDLCVLRASVIEAGPQNLSVSASLRPSSPHDHLA